MTPRFDFAPEASATLLRLVGPAGPIPVDRWAVEAPRTLLRGVDVANRLLAAESAVAEGDTLLVEHRSIAGLSAEGAKALQLPPAIEAIGVIDTEGLVTRPDFSVRLRWERSTGQALPGARRVGAWLDLAGAWRRLPEPLFSIAEAVDRFAALDPADEAGRMRALADLRELLPDAIEGGEARAPGFLGRLRIAVADAFSLDLEGRGPEAKLVPVLHRARTTNEGGEPLPLLDPDRQRRFGHELFHAYGTARGVYVVGSGDWVVLTPTLRKALQVVRNVQSATWSTKLAFFRSPRAVLEEKLGHELDETVIEQVFLETRAYGERVIGLGLWQPRVLPWVQVDSTDWFGPETGDQNREGTTNVAKGGLIVGDRRVELGLQRAKQLRDMVEQAIGRGEPIVPWTDADGTIVGVPANTETLRAIQVCIDRETGSAVDEKPKAGARRAPTEPEVLVIVPNESELGFEAVFRKRAAGKVGSLPASLRTPLKEHQRDGVLWLQRCWEAGRPGVLLADEMGLGKTLQVLTFLAWLRDAMGLGVVARAPILVVAPTGLLANWKAEHDRHLTAPGLGRPLEAFGRGLTGIKRPREDGSPGIDPKALENADWVLTTYETLRDYDRDFGAVRFAAIAFDEAQKIKNPAVRLTDAAKAMQAEFTIAITGTPVENRLADLWCICDAAHPGLLGELRSFSDRFEREPSPERLARLRRLLDDPNRATPPFLLRRLRTDHLPDLPDFTVERCERPMPERQRRAYEHVIASARGATGSGRVLEALQRLRAVCLHPEPGLDEDDALIAASARLAVAIEALDRIRECDEAAILFLDDLDVMARLRGLLQRRYRLPEPPPVVSGDVAGGRRQNIVDAFQRGRGFGLVLLSPRAGGVGLTLTRANHVIHLARWWNPAVEDQCNGRVLRIGQERPVTIHLPIAVLGDGRRSFDQNLDALLERKRRLFRDTLAPPAASDEELGVLLTETAP
ncbi:MAG: DEAD/DEAH box helicase [Geminicoccaceae bacterium]|nr:DEAD/DEAH box helicase [Geminicoccaceae bacterium]MCX7631343.1 DEAD/DEAH box helicase [Geminicoccaceae bacterium]